MDDRTGQPLTNNQLAILEFLSLWEAGRTAYHPPTYAEIMDGARVRSLAIVHDNMMRLSNLGYINWEPRMARTVRLTQKGREAR